MYCNRSGNCCFLSCKNSQKPNKIEAVHIVNNLEKLEKTLMLSSSIVLFVNVQH